jgi:lysophospholipase L1-like esterase
MLARTSTRKNRIIDTLWVSIIIIVALLLLSFLPDLSIGKYQLKKIDILSDLHPDPPVEIPPVSDSVVIEEIIKEIPASGKSVITTIENYSSDEKTLKYFYKALQNVSKNQVRIAFFGDSFIEGDIISASLRDTLQNVFGGEGVGIVPLASETAGFRKSIKHTYSHWDTYSLLSALDSGVTIGISGYTYIPQKDNTVNYKPGKTPYQENFKAVKLFYRNSGSASVNYQINDEPEVSHLLDASDSIKQLVITHNSIKSIQLRVTPHDSIALFGVSVENSKGVYVDNFSLRRNSGIALGKLSPDLLKQFNNYLDYKLIILQYGLNVASENDSTNYAWYTRKMVKIINDLKEVFPETSFLLLSVSDRGINKDGKIVTMDAIPKMRNMQREIARKCDIAFWDLYEAMGGRNSVITYTESKPPLAARDYTHLTHLGGHKIGRKLADALLHEINKHEKKSNLP